MTDKLLLAEEPYVAIQGEGRFVGVPMIFIRLQGCDVGCSWCDSYYTWSPYNKKKVSSKITQFPLEWSFEQLNEKLRRIGDVKHIWITGGEPMLQADQLVNFIENGDKFWHLCTAGTIYNQDIEKLMDYITVDVKAPSSGTRSNKDVLDKYYHGGRSEFKMVVANTTVDRAYAHSMATFTYGRINWTLQPLYSSEPAIVNGAKPSQLGTWKDYEHFSDWFLGTFMMYDNVRLGLQLHKVLYPDKQRGI